MTQKLSRRAALSAGVSAVALAGVPASVNANPDAELLRRAERAMSIIAEVTTPTGKTDDEVERLLDAVDVEYDAIVALPAHTVEGCKIKLRIICDELGFPPDDIRKAAAQSLMADLDRIGGAS